MKLRRTERSVASAAAKAGMDEKTARKYLRLGKPPSQLQLISEGPPDLRPGLKQIRQELAAIAALLRKPR